MSKSTRTDLSANCCKQYRAVTELDLVWLTQDPLLRNQNGMTIYKLLPLENTRIAVLLPVPMITYALIWPRVFQEIC